MTELASTEAARSANHKLGQTAPGAGINDLAEYDAIVAGRARFGRVSSPIASFLGRAGGQWAKGALHGKVGGAFASSATRHDGHETTLFTIFTNLVGARYQGCAIAETAAILHS
nr:hypothetical protein [Bradyrhizobium sp. AS23.2]